jgi:hypothetical protein
MVCIGLISALALLRLITWELPVVVGWDPAAALTFITTVWLYNKIDPMLRLLTELGAPRQGVPVTASRV